jgi:hypothetical protein
MGTSFDGTRRQQLFLLKVWDAGITDDGFFSATYRTVIV